MNSVNATLQLTTGFQTVYNNSVLTLVISIIRITNTTGGAVTVSLCYVPDGGTAADNNAVLWQFSLGANDFLEFGQGDVISPATTIQAKASANTSITMRVSGQQE